MKKITIIFFLAMVIQSFVLIAQEKQKAFQQDDVFSVFVKKEKRKISDSLNALPIVLYKPYLAVTPFIGYNPAYGMLVGIATSIGMFLGSPVNTTISSACVGLNITTKDQIIITARTNVITSGSRFILRGDWRYLIFSQPTYGLGTGIKMHTNRGIVFDNGGETASFPPEAQPLNYNYIRLYETFFINLTKQIYFGIGYCLDDYTKIVDHKLTLDTIPRIIASHYKYSTEHGFNPEKYTVSGLSIELLLDSRNSSIRPVKGFFANIGLRPNLTFLGSTKSSWMLNTEFRTYVSVSKRRPEHLIGFWYLGQFTEKGKVPYLGLPAITWDMYNRAGRGYVQGSIRGVNFLYGEPEYRFPISRYTGILGGVLFVNVTTASSDDNTRKLFQYFDPAMGAGLRIMFNRKTLSNLCIDAGFGADGTIGIYFNLNEAF